MLTPGLCSVALRRLPAEQVVAVAADAGLRAIEWGGDIHVPPGDLDNARTVRRLTVAAGLSVAAYGSYFRLGDPGATPEAFNEVLATGLALGAPTIRVWPGSASAGQIPAAVRTAWMAQALACCTQAQAAGLTVSWEWHAGTLLSTDESARAFLAHTAHPAARSYWQPPHGSSVEQACANLRIALPGLSNLHVFHWWPDEEWRHPLAAGADRWESYLRLAAGTGRRHTALIEFVRDDDPAQLRRDAATLLALIAAVN